MMTPAPGSHVTCPQPTELLWSHMWSLPSGAQLYSREGPALLLCPLLMCKNPLEPLITMSQTLATSSHTATTLAHGPWASPMLDPMSFRLLFPFAAG